MLDRDLPAARLFVRGRGVLLTRLAVIVFWLGVVVALMSVRVVIESHSELERAKSLQSSGDLDGAVVHFRRALRWYAPANPYSRQAGVQLLQMGRDAADAGQPSEARRTYRALLAGIQSARTFLVPYRDLHQSATDALSSLNAEMELPEAPSTGGVIHFTSILVVFGFLLWSTSALGFAMGGLDQNDRIIRRRAIGWSASFAVGMLSFLVGMAFG